MRNSEFGILGAAHSILIIRNSEFGIQNFGCYARHYDGASRVPLPTIKKRNGRPTPVLSFCFSGFCNRPSGAIDIIALFIEATYSYIVLFLLFKLFDC